MLGNGLSLYTIDEDVHFSKRATVNIRLKRYKSLDKPKPFG